MSIEIELKDLENEQYRKNLITRFHSYITIGDIQQNRFLIDYGTQGVNIVEEMSENLNWMEPEQYYSELVELLEAAEGEVKILKDTTL